VSKEAWRRRLLLIDEHSKLEETETTYKVPPHPPRLTWNGYSLATPAADDSDWKRQMVPSPRRSIVSAGTGKGGSIVETKIRWLSSSWPVAAIRSSHQEAIVVVVGGRSNADSKAVVAERDTLSCWKFIVLVMMIFRYDNRKLVLGN
jgi:hypothetical protein